MSPLTRLTFALLAGATLLPAFAADRTPIPAQPGRAAAVAAEQASVARLLVRPAIAKPLAATAKSVARSAAVNQPTANPVRAYPPSCLADPLPDTPSGPIWTTNVNLYEQNGTAGSYEGVTITIWRIPCSSTQFYNSVTLMRIQRQAQYEGDSTLYPLFPGVRVAQANSTNTINFDDPNHRDYVRVALEPDTVISDVTPDSPIVFSTTYVLENYPYQGSGFFDFNLPFQIRFDNFITGGSVQQQYILSVPGYNPNSIDYPTYQYPLAINGYLSGLYYDPAHSGEGLNFQVLEIPGAGQNVVDFAWFTYDSTGTPFWLGGEATIPAGANSVNVPVFYTAGGGFAGNFGANVSRNPWGTVSVSFQNCNTVNFSYASNPGLPTGVPAGSGMKSWTRVAGLDLNALTCE